jgi:tetratricopeptide (TPR) repeat protein
MSRDINGSRASHQAVAELKAEGVLPAQTLVRASKYLNNVIEQDHRKAPQRCYSMLGFKTFGNAEVTLSGIELAKQICNRKNRRDLNPIQFWSGCNTRTSACDRSAKAARLAISFFESAVKLDPQNADSYASMADCWVLLSTFAHQAESALKSMPKAKKLAEQALQINPNIAIAHYALASQAALERLDSVAEKQNTYLSPHTKSHIFLGLGDTERAIEYLEKTFDERGCYLVCLTTDLLYESLRSDPRFRSLVHRVGFADAAEWERTLA